MFSLIHKFYCKLYADLVSETMQEDADFVLTATEEKVGSWMCFPSPCINYCEECYFC